MQNAGLQQWGTTTETFLHHEVEKRYLAYALSTIVSRALPDVRDGLKPVHRRILFAMHAMRLSDSSRMRKSAAVVGEVIGKYHPHGDQAAYDALVRIAQDFSLRYPLVDGSGNFGSVDGDAPAAMRYTEIRLSAFAGLLLREIDQGTTTFRPTYDAMSEEPLVLPAAVPNLLLNGSSGIAVGMSCSFPPHNLAEVIAACRAAIRTSDASNEALLSYIKGPDFPTGGEILDQPEGLAEVYTTGHGAIRLRGTYEIEKTSRGKQNLIITSIPYSVNKSRLIERIAGLIVDKRLKQVVDVRDESAQDVRIVLELKNGDVSPETVMAFLYRHTELQINFPVNLIAITPQGVPERLSLSEIIRYFLEFRYEKTVLRLEHRLEILQKRIHILEGFDLLFQNLDGALRIIRSARSRQEAARGIKQAFALDDEQVDAILEMRLYKLVGMEIGKILEELGLKRKESREIQRDLASSDRLWKIIDTELAQLSERFSDQRRTRIVEEQSAGALVYDPDEFLDHEDATVVLSKQGWIRRMKSELDDPASLKFREGDELFGWLRVNTGSNVAIFSNAGKVYIMRAIEVPSSTGFGEPIGNLLRLTDGETVAGFIAPDPAKQVEPDPGFNEPTDGSLSNQGPEQMGIFDLPGNDPQAGRGTNLSEPSEAILVTRMGKGFRFDYEVLRETSKRGGRKLVALKDGDETLSVTAVDGTIVVIGTDGGNVLAFPVDQVPVLSGPGQGVRLMRLKEGSRVVSIQLCDPGDQIILRQKDGKDKTIPLNRIPCSNRGGQGKRLCAGLAEVELVRPPAGAAS